MRELVYLSERKLRQFQAPKRRRFSIREIGIPGIGQVGIDQQPDAHLDAVIAHLQRMARWYEEDVPVGQWVHFEARLARQLVVSKESGLRVLLFAEPAVYAGARRLVLHGAPDHLLDRATEPKPSDWGDDSYYSGSFGPVVRPLMRHLATALDGTTSHTVYRGELVDLTNFLDRELDPSTAAWLGGYARVTVDTADLPLVVASPLFVEYVSPPDQ